MYNFPVSRKDSVSKIILYLACPSFKLRWKNCVVPCCLLSYCKIISFNKLFKINIVIKFIKRTINLMNWIELDSKNQHVPSCPRPRSVPSVPFWTKCTFHSRIKLVLTWFVLRISLYWLLKNNKSFSELVIYFVNVVHFLNKKCFISYYILKTIYCKNIGFIMEKTLF